MKKNLIIFSILCFFTSSEVIFADTKASISVSTSNTIVGNSGSATVTVSSDGVLGQVYGTFSCGGLGSTDLYYYNNDGATVKSKTYTIKWTAKSAGTYTCSVSGLQVGTLTNPEEGVKSIGATSKTITVISSSSSSSSGSSSSGGTTSDKKTYSSDNNLKSLSIDDFELSPTFNKDTTEYSLTVDQSVETVKINATANDDKASVSGIGEVNLSDGDNNIEVKVTAENGNEKIYKIKITVEDQNPIIVTIDDKEYTIMKKNNDIIDKLDDYEEGTIVIDGQEVVSYSNPNNNLTLVILKDEEGNLGYYVYKDNEYTLYEENTFNAVRLYLLEMPEDKIPDGYKEYTFTYNEKEYTGYKLNEGSDYYLIYAMDVNTGEENLYLYDSKTSIASRYDDGIYEYYNNQYNTDTKIYKTIIVGLIGIDVLAVIILVIKSIIKSKKRRNTNVKLNRKVN